jgi:uncharacterized membrane protein
LLVKVPLVVAAVDVAAAAQAEDEAVEVPPTVISESLEAVVDQATAAVAYGGTPSYGGYGGGSYGNPSGGGGGQSWW